MAQNERELHSNFFFLLYGRSSLPKMQVVYLNEKTEFSSMAIREKKYQNKFGTMYGLNKKLELVSTQHTLDYYVFRSKENDKMFLCLNSNSQIGDGLRKIRETLTAEHKFTFKPETDKVYIRMTEDQAFNFPKNRNLLAAVNVKGDFKQNDTGLAFVQYELSGWKDSHRVDFEVNDNAVFP